MGQKVNPHGLRVGVINDWNTKWYADSKEFGDLLVEDNKIRNYLKEKLYQAGISKIEIERAAGRIKVIILTAKPGIIIGKEAAGVKALKEELQAMTSAKVSLNIVEVKRPERDAQLVAENIAKQLEDRVSFRRAMKKAMSSAMKAGAKGIKTTVGGRVGGAEIARDESYNEGVLPLQTLRANIDYGFCEAHTAYGKLGVKVWINHGEVLQSRAKKEGSDN
ncbi:MAG: 30S ribosomal protein S3 [Firmicutes bacterium]|jgi:small subunit ribosomal protein S3|nr:30S ribosomal protein S3 [Bacillota bacterium]MBR3404831.1 30S ribosomal protein S3 [Bacillota bacterium]